MKRFQSTKIASFLGIFFNLLLFIIKLIVSLITSSQSMMADAMNSLGDIFSSLMTWIGNKIASKPKDHDHNLGHGKAEYIYSLFISVIIMIMAITLIKDSFFSLFSPTEYHFSIWLVIVCLITILSKVSLYIYIHHLSKDFDSLLLKANAKDHLYDAFITCINLSAILLTQYGIYFIDGIAGIFIALWIFYQGFKICKESYDVLMDKTMNPKKRSEVLKIIKKYPNVKRMSHFVATPVGYQYQISFTIYVDGNLSTYQSHKIANQIEQELKKLPEIYFVVIHVNPI